LTSKLRHLARAITSAKYPDGWYDGEAVVLNAQGAPDFGALQRAFDGAKVSDIVLYLFDLPYCDSRDLRAVPLERRRALLETIVAKNPADALRFSETFDGALNDILGAACKLGLEGVIGKRRGSRYISQRSADWIKLKCGERQEFVVGGFTEPKGSRDGFGALLLGVHADDGSLTYVGKVGSGFSDASLKDIAKKLAPLRQSSSPFASVPAEHKRAHWVKPQVLAEVSFSEWTDDQHLRHPVFVGIRMDKDASMIRRETPASADIKRPFARAAASRTPLSVPSLNVTHGERILDETTGLTKLELVRYYALIGSLMMPHLKQRPVSLVRAPAGFAGELFFQKHIDQTLPAGLKALDPALDPGHDPLVAVVNASGLIASAQWNVIEFHTTNAVATHMERPDRLIFDLDPGTGVTWPQVQTAAELVRGFLAELELVCFAKTSGGKGIHIVVPIKRQYEWAVAKDFAHAIVTHLARVLPTHFVDKSGPKNRVGKIFVDYLRNSRGATTVSAWSARARPGAGVSVPVAWNEIAKLKSADQWNVRNIHSRLDQGNTPWAGYDQAANTLARAMRSLDYRPLPTKEVQ
jgi:bifunctional non-homologous end joining protein LigD